MDMRIMGPFIAALRQERGISRAELARMLCVKEKTIEAWETARREVDLGMLPNLAGALGVSVQELLDGARSTDGQIDHVGTVARICRYAGARLKAVRNRDLVMIFVALFVLLRLIVSFVPDMIDDITQVMGDPNCVVAADYSSLTFFGEKYVPLITDGLECEWNECIFEEVQVENATLFSKLFFGESLHAIRNVPNHEVVYLLTDMDVLDSQYFVRESELEKYERLLAQSQFDQYYVSTWLEGGYCLDVPFSDQLGEALRSFERMEQVETNDLEYARWLDIRAYEKEMIFYLPMGHVEMTKEMDLWVPDEYTEREDAYPVYYSSNRYYPIDPSFHEELLHLSEKIHGYWE